MPEKKPQMLILDGDGSFEIEVVGESHHYKNLRKVAGSCDRHAVEVVKTAYMVPEPRNVNDPNAIRIDIDELPVGYLPRSVAAQIAPVLRRSGLVAIQAQATVSAFEGADNYSVWLDGDLNEVLTGLSTPGKPWWKLW